MCRCSTRGSASQPEALAVVAMNPQCQERDDEAESDRAVNPGLLKLDRSLSVRRQRGGW